MQRVSGGRLAPGAHRLAFRAGGSGATTFASWVSDVLAGLPVIQLVAIGTKRAGTRPMGASGLQLPVASVAHGPPAAVAMWGLSERPVP